MKPFLALVEDDFSERRPSADLLSEADQMVTAAGEGCVPNGGKRARMLRFEVTNEQYLNFIKHNRRWAPDRINVKYHDGNYLRHWEKGMPPRGREYHPVTYVSWHAADAYCRWRGGRLPSKQEWMSFAGCSEDGSLKAYPWGDEFAENKCNVSFRVGTTVPVGYYDGASDAGCYDLCGNVWEWTSSREGIFYVLKGGSWGGYTRIDARTGSEYKSLSQRTGNHIGFRCVWDE